MPNIIPRPQITGEIDGLLKIFPVVAVIGARQVGKTTIAKLLAQTRPSVYLDLEDEEDQAKLSEPKLFFDLHKDQLIILDEIQFMPKLFNTLRSYVDKNPDVKFLMLGSASPDLIRNASETLAGRIAYYRLPPFLFSEISDQFQLYYYWLRGGFPKSLLLLDKKESWVWRKNFIDTFLYRDTKKFGFNYPPETLRRLLKYLAFANGNVVNMSIIGENFGISHTTVRRYIDYLVGTFMLYVVQPYLPNIKKRFVKKPKIYLADTGLLHFMLNLNEFDDLMAHQVYGSSWETLVLQNIYGTSPDVQVYFYRTAAGAEIDFVLEIGRKVIAVECKTDFSPNLTKGFWSAITDIRPDQVFVVVPKSTFYPTGENVFVCGLDHLTEKIRNLAK